MRPAAKGRGAHRRSSELPGFVTLGNTQRAFAEQQRGHRSGHPDQPHAVGAIGVGSRFYLAVCSVAD